MHVHLSVFYSISSILPNWTFLIFFAVVGVAGVLDLCAVRVKLPAAKLAVVLVI